MSRFPSDLTDYLGRKYDLAVYDAPVGAGTVSEAAATPQAAAGVRKLAQRYLIRLTTKAGSMAGDPSFGSVLMTRASSGALRTNADVQTAFQLSNASVYRALLAEDEIRSKPDDERMASATLLRSSLTGDSLKMTIRLVAVSGDQTTLLAQLPTPTA